VKEVAEAQDSMTEAEKVKENKNKKGGDTRMKKLILAVVLMLAALPLMAGQVGTTVDVGITTAAVYSAVSGNVLAIYPADDGNTEAARTITLIDVAGNTPYTKTFIKGAELPEFIFHTPVYSGSTTFGSHAYIGIPISGGGVSITSGFKCKVVISK